MFLVTFDFEHAYIKKPCYASGIECKSCEISNQMFLNVIFLFSEEDELTSWLWHKDCKMRLFSGTISYGAPEGGSPLGEIIENITQKIRLFLLKMPHQTENKN